jgi:hypothetical protein
LKLLQYHMPAVPFVEQDTITIGAVHPMGYSTQL